MSRYEAGEDTSHIKDEKGFVTVDISGEVGTPEKNSKVREQQVVGNKSEQLLERIGEKASKYLPKRGSLGRLFGEREKPPPQQQNVSADITVYTIDKEMNRGKRGPTERHSRNPEIIERLRRTKQSPPTTGEVTRSAGVQVSPYPPYRLYCLPQDDWRDSDSRMVAAGRLVCCICGLANLYFIWVMFAALAFYFTEGPAEYQQALDLNDTEVSLAVSLATDMRLVSTDDPVWRLTIEKYMARHQELLLDAAKAGYSDDGPLWSFPGCILYTVTLFSILGFGSPTLQTVTGQIFAVFFLLTGLPLHFLLVRNLGLAVATKIHLAAKELDVKFKHLKRRVHSVRHSLGDPTEDKEVWPEDMFTSSECSPPPGWVRLLPLVSLCFYYLVGVLLFGVCRWLPSPSAGRAFLFPGDFIASGGLASAGGWARATYSLFLEGAVILVATNLAVVAFPPSIQGCQSSLTSVAVRLDLVTNSVE